MTHTVDSRVSEEEKLSALETYVAIAAPGVRRRDIGVFTDSKSQLVQGWLRCTQRQRAGSDRDSCSREGSAETASLQCFSVISKSCNFATLRIGDYSAFLVKKFQFDRASFLR